MSPITRLEPLAPERAGELLALLNQAGAESTQALVLDEQGRVLGVVGADDSCEPCSPAS